jgi:hypothetical protein
MCAKQEFFVSFAQLGVAEQENSGIFLCKRARLAKQAHIDLFEEAIAFFTIARFTRSYEILPCALPTTGTWYDMVERQFAAMLPTILTGFFIA